jgi:hypothetical protein
MAALPMQGAVPAFGVDDRIVGKQRKRCVDVALGECRDQLLLDGDGIAVCCERGPRARRAEGENASQGKQVRI